MALGYYSGDGHVYTCIACIAINDFKNRDSKYSEDESIFQKSNLSPGLMMHCIAIKDLRKVLRACWQIESTSILVFNYVSLHIIVGLFTSNARRPMLSSSDSVST